MNKDLKDLLKVCYGDTSELDENRVAELKQRLAEDAGIRQELANELYFNGLVQEVQTSAPRWLKIDKILETEEEGDSFESLVMNDITAFDRKNAQRRWFQIISTLAAGLCMGFMGTSAAYGKNIFHNLAQSTVSFLESFEGHIDYYKQGVPTKDNQWGGDSTLIVQSENGVSPVDGHSMLKISNSTFDGEVSKGNTRQGNVYYLLDLEKYNLDQTKTYICKASANFMNASDLRTECNIQILSLPSEAEMPEKQMSANWVMKQSLTFAQKRLPLTAKGSWQSIKVETALPVESRYLILSVYVTDVETKERRPSQFEKHYLDKVSINIFPVD